MSLSSSTTVAAPGRARWPSARLAGMAISLPPHCKRLFAIGGASLQRPGRALASFSVVEVHAVGGLVLDADPQRR